MTLGREALGIIQYRQMCGRAGRAGQTSYGESYLVIKGFEREKALQLVRQKLPSIESQMHPQSDGGSAFLKAIVEAIGLGLCQEREGLKAFLENTLLFFQYRDREREKENGQGYGQGQAKIGGERLSLDAVLSLSLQYLINARVVSEDSLTLPTLNSLTHNNAHNHNHQLQISAMTSNAIQRLSVTKLGRAMVATGLDPDEAVVIYDALTAAQSGLYLESALHLLYLVAPWQHALTINFRSLLARYDAAQRQGSSSKKGSAGSNTSAGNMKIQGLKEMFQLIGLDPVLLSTWTIRPPSYQDLALCANTVQLSGIARLFSQSPSQSASHSTSATTGSTVVPLLSNARLQELKALCVAKRLWAALALQAQIEGGWSYEQIAKEFVGGGGGANEGSGGGSRGGGILEIEMLLRSTRVMAHRIEKFAKEMGWQTMEKMIGDFKHNSLSMSIPKEIKKLMILPRMSRKVAMVFAENGITTLEELVDEHNSGRSIDQLVLMLQLSIGFELQVCHVIYRVLFWKLTCIHG
jgi:hypothetical protein